MASFGSWVCSHIPCTTILRACTTPFQVVCLLWPIKADLWYLFWGRGQNYRKYKVLLIKTCSYFSFKTKSEIWEKWSCKYTVLKHKLWSLLKLQLCFGPNLHLKFSFSKKATKGDQQSEIFKALKWGHPTVVYLI